MKPSSYATNCVYFWLLVFGLLPIALVFICAFLHRDEQSLVSLPFTIQAFVDLLNPMYIKVLYRSVYMATLTTAVCLLLALPFSYAMVKSRHQSLLLFLIIIPFWTSSLVRTYSLIAVLKNKGLLNNLLLKLHIIHTPMDLLYTNFAVVCGLVYNLFPFMVLPIYTNMERFDFRLLEAAQDLGANSWQRFWRVFIPGNSNGIVAGCILVSLPAMTLFYIPNVLGGARSILIGNLIQDQFLMTQDWPQGAATSLLLTLLLLTLLAIFRKYSKGLMQ